MKRFLSAALSVLMITSLLCSMTEAYADGSWRKNDTGWWYRNEDGSWPADQWQRVGGRWYHFDGNGYMQTGWIRDGERWYYLNPSGAMATGWVKSGDAWYYLYSSGVMAVGWVKSGDGWYYLTASGAMATGWWKLDGTWYHFRPSGRMTAGGWAEDDGDWRWMDASGRMVWDTWIEYNGGWYYIGDDACMVTGWQQIDGEWYRFDSSGRLAETGAADPIAVALAETETAKKTSQIVLVVDHSLTLWTKTENGWEKSMDTYCGYGWNGLSADRREGDGTTPVGSFPLTLAFGLGENPGTAMTYRRITEKSYWSGENDGTYNTWVESETPVGGEHLADYYQYKYAIAIGFNMDPVIPGRGSAIFIHCRSTDHWHTGGCVSLVESEMLTLMLTLKDGAYILIVPDEASIPNW